MPSLGGGSVEQPWTCPTCSKTISEDDTVVLARDRVVHFYCRRPQVLREKTPAPAAIRILTTRDRRVAGSRPALHDGWREDGQRPLARFTLQVRACGLMFER